MILIAGVPFSSYALNNVSVNVKSKKTLSVNVGEIKSFKIGSGTNYHNIDWQIMGDQVIIVDRREVDFGDQMSAAGIGGGCFVYTDWITVTNDYVWFYGLKPGKCTVIAKCFKNSTENNLAPVNLSYVDLYEIEITVNGTEPQSMVMQHQLHLEVGKTHTLSPRLLPSGSSSTLTWYSSNTSVATVSSAGVITAKAVGDATITCVTANGLREDCDVTVTPTMVSSLSLNQEQLMMNVGEQYQLGASVTPQNATYQQVVWKSMNPDVVSVDENGMASCLSNGWSVILATTVDGSNLTAGCFVRVGASNGGDVNNDGSIDIQDVTALIDYLLRG